MNDFPNPKPKYPWLVIISIIAILLFNLCYENVNNWYISNDETITNYQKFEYLHDKGNESGSTSELALMHLKRAVTEGDPDAIIYIANNRPRLLYMLYLADKVDIDIERFKNNKALHGLLAGYTHIHTRPSDYAKGLDVLIDILDTKYRNTSLLMITEIFDSLNLYKDRYVWDQVIKHFDAGDSGWTDMSSVIQEAMTSSQILHANSKAMNTIEMIKSGDKYGLKSLWLEPLKQI